MACPLLRRTAIIKPFYKPRTKTDFEEYTEIAVDL